MKKKADKPKSRYAKSVIYYKSLSCRASLYEDRIITDYCIKNRFTKSMFLAAAAMYCASNNISADELLEYVTNGKDFNYKDYLKDEYEE
ncbi:MAG: hypothetical protein IKW96_02790 [Ruminococcus sp.]|uniref:hypothetical protein n=1 Tax=Ruminococcus sp. TaxID=41978 RepID=UPI0025F8D182|nr:hypothetical protein [Ruminococcus sp.]MBR5682200.1 hypothetical protein [Ruminococcus sp.]